MTARVIVALSVGRRRRGKDAGDTGREVARKKERRAGDVVLGHEPAERGAGGGLPESLLGGQPALCLAAGEAVAERVGEDGARADGVDADTTRA